MIKTECARKSKGLSESLSRKTSLYSTKKLSIFNQSIIKILNYYIERDDFKH